MEENILLTSLEDPSSEDPYNVIFENSQPPPQTRFLGAAMRDYRPISAISSLTQTSENYRNSLVTEDIHDPSAPMMPKAEVSTSSDPEKSDPVLSSTKISAEENPSSEYVKKEAIGYGDSDEGNPTKRKNFLIGCAAIALVATIIIGVLLGSILGTQAQRKSHGGSMSSESNAGGSTVSAGSKKQMLWGTGGQFINTEDGHKFYYNNTLGGTWVAVPYNDTAKPQGDQPSLAEKWDYSANRILGVNLGGWLVLEPFIVPSLFEPYADSANPVVDEWDLSQRLGAKAAETIENHYKTFITEQDFAEIASAGLNWVRLPIGFWMIDTWNNEPLVQGVSFKYLLKAITWARKYGLRINLDLHAVPGSQNGWNHSGKLGKVGFLSGAMGIANAQRTLNYIQTLTQFIAQPQYKNVIPMFSVLNEAAVATIGGDVIRSWYYQVYQMLRSIGGTGEGNGPFMVIHDGFMGTVGWNGFLQGADRLGIDTHSYFCFGNQNLDSVATNSAKPCLQWSGLANATMTGFGLSLTGEFSLAINDCGLFVNNVGAGSRYEGTFPTAMAPDPGAKRLGDCAQWLDDRLWTPETKNAFADLAQTQQDVMRNSFFWTWKIGNSIKQDNVPNPMWNYQHGLHSGYIRPDARISNGRCAAVVASQGGIYAPNIVAGDLAPWQTGGLGAGQVAPGELAKYNRFPPDNISGAPGGGTYPTATLPKYLPTGTPATLVPIPASAAAGSGQANPTYQSKWFMPQPGCQYPDPWNAVEIPAPTPVCGA